VICDCKKEVRLVDLGLLASTRVLLGVGLGLVLGRRLPAGLRRPVGAALVALGFLSTLPIACRIWCRRD
jgi:hypothetical protein